jgi:glycosyltransferase involved in cell wall biosynthesis
MKSITVVIVFLNEGIEVYNTVKSLRENSNIEDVEIILIDDASIDNYDYKSIAKKFDAAYYRNKTRIGAAESRHEGVFLCNTEFFILIDAHMRIYQKDWIPKLIESLKRNKESIICCQTIPLNENGIVKNNYRLNYGAYIDFKDLSVKWNSIDFSPNKNECVIPCVLGASYATSKRYWAYLKGTKGLKSYGFEEQLISIKSWLAGGNCILRKDIVFGHIFRTPNKVPYELINWDFMYNRFYISTLFLGSKDFFFEGHTNEEIKKFRKMLISDIEENHMLIENQLRWYKKIFKDEISSIITMNNKYKKENELNMI